MIRVGLVDDDREHIRFLRSFLSRYEQESELQFKVTEFRDGMDFVEDYNGNLSWMVLRRPSISGSTTPLWPLFLSPTSHNTRSAGTKWMPLILWSNL